MSSSMKVSRGLILNEDKREHFRFNSDARNNYTPGTKVSTCGGLPTSLQYRGEAERAEVSFYMASVAEYLISRNKFMLL